MIKFSSTKLLFDTYKKLDVILNEKEINQEVDTLDHLTDAQASIFFAMLSINKLSISDEEEQEIIEFLDCCNYFQEFWDFLHFNGGSTDN